MHGSSINQLALVSSIDALVRDLHVLILPRHGWYGLEQGNITETWFSTIDQGG